MAISDLRSLSELARKPRTRAGKEVLTLDTKDVIPKDDQVRKRFDGIEELANSLRVNGQVQPIIVYPPNEDGKYVIQKGERRWRAASMAGLTIEAIVDDKAYSALDETAGELVENIQRDALTPLEIAHGLQKFVDEGWKKKQIAERLGKTASYVSAHLTLLKMPDCVHEIYEKDITRDPETLNNLRQLYELSPQSGEKACAQAFISGIGRKQSRDLLNAAKQEITNKAKGSTNNYDNENENQASLEESSKGSAKNDTQNEIAGRKRSDQETSPLNSQSANATWIQALPAHIRVYVNAEDDKGSTIGYLATDRIDSNREYCWIITEDQTPKRFPVSSVRLLYIDA